MVKRNRFGQEELKYVAQALESGDLWPYVYTGSPQRRHFSQEAKDLTEKHFRDRGADGNVYMVPTASGTASIHVALGGLKIPAGSEVITTPITDPGTVMPIIFHNTIPVFADVDPTSGLITKATVKNLINHRTSAIIAVHLTGSPADIDGIKEAISERRAEDTSIKQDIKIIEDVAQGLGASYKGRPLGTLGDAGCFSLNSQKHITVGEGGFVLLGNEPDFYRCHNFSDKHRDRWDVEGEHGKYKGIGHSLRMSELQAAMLLAQIEKLDGLAQRRHEFGAAVDDALRGDGRVTSQVHFADSHPTFFFHMFAISDPDKSDLRDALKKRIRVHLARMQAEYNTNEPDEEKHDPFEGISVRGSYSNNDTPVYKYDVFQGRSFFPNSRRLWPAELVAIANYDEISEGYYDYRQVSCPMAESYLSRSLSIYLDERHGEWHGEKVAEAVKLALDEVF
ncbi:MAG: DegT/DnrJ/EryC1/StrS family aminotransferase [Pseudomonadota bacterium]